MAIVLTKKKLVDAPSIEAGVPDFTLSDFAELIDRVGALQEDAEKVQARIAKEQEKLKPYSDALKELKERIAEIEGKDDEEIEELGSDFYVHAGKRGTSRSITDMGKVRKLLGDDLFMQLATVTLKNIDDYLTLPQKAMVLKTDRTTRTIKVVRRA